MHENPFFLALDEIFMYIHTVTRHTDLFHKFIMMARRVADYQKVELNPLGNVHQKMGNNLWAS